MAANSGPKIVRTGLIAFYDPGSEKSFRGIAATNLMYGINNVYSPANDGTLFKTAYGTESVFIPYFNQNINVKYVDIYNDYNGGSTLCCPSPFRYHSSSIAVSGNTTYMYQIIYKTDNGYSSAAYMYRYEYNSSSAYVTEGGVLDVSRTESLGDGWIHAWGSFTTNANTAFLTGFLFHYEYINWNRIRVAAVSLTQGSLVHRPEHIINLDFRASRGNTTGSGGGLKDLIGSNDAELINGVSYNGSFGGSLVFDGVNDYCRFTLPSSSTISVSAWVMSSSWSTQTHPMIIAKGINVEWILWKSDDVGQDEKFAWRSGDSSTVYSTTTAQNNIWYHLVGTVGPDGMKLYVNGILESSNAVSTVPLGLVDPCIGCGLSSNNPSNFLLGNVTLVKIWNRQITAAEVLTNYKSTRPRFTQSTNRNTIFNRKIINPLSTSALYNSVTLYLDPADKNSFIPSSPYWYDLSPNRRIVKFYTNGGSIFNLSAPGDIGFSSEGGGSLIFDGVNDWGYLDSSMYIGTNVTFSAWVKLTSSRNGGFAIFSHCSSATFSVSYNVGGGSIRGLAGHSYVSSNLVFNGRSPLNVGKWINVVWVKQGLSMKTYLNGVLSELFDVPEITGHMRSICNRGTACVTTTGSAADSYTAMFTGSIGPLITWSRALSGTEVKQLWNNFKYRYLLKDIVEGYIVLNLSAFDKLSATSSTAWFDLSGNGYNATPANGTSLSLNVGQYNFDGVDDYCSLNFTWPTIFTLNIWVSILTGQAGQYSRIISSGPSDNFELAINSSGQLSYFSDGIWRDNIITLSLPVKIHLTFINNSGVATIYVNGILSYTGTASSASGSTSLYLGSRYNNTEYSKIGLNQVIVYNGALSNSEISQNFNAERWRFGI